MKYFATERLGPKQSLTPEGFLLCEGTPIARTGTLFYVESEIKLAPDEGPLDPSPDGLIRAERSQEDVFRAETMASFEGKTVTDDHPPEGVTAKNWRQYAVGHLQNVRRGEGIESDLMLADIVVKDPDAIEAVREGKREVSCGYDFKFQVIGPGRGRQYDIIGNHVALVDQGRCGSRCSIGDKQMSATAKKKTIMDRLLAAVRGKDEAAAKEIVGELVGDSEDIAETSGAGTTSGTNVHIHMPGSGGGEAAATKDEGEAGAKKEADDPLKAINDSISKLGTDIGTRMDGFEQRIGKLEGGGKAADEKSDEDDKKDDDKKDDKKADDKSASAGDSSKLEPTYQDTVSRAEILVPGIELPKFVRGQDAKATSDGLCSFRRKVLDQAYTTDGGKLAIDAMLAGAKLDTKAMACDAVSILFNGASENVKAMNRQRGVITSRIMRGSDTQKGVEISDINKKNREFWGKR